VQYYFTSRSKEAAQLFEKFEANLHVKVGMSHSNKIDFHKLFKNDEVMIRKFLLNFIYFFIISDNECSSTK